MILDKVVLLLFTKKVKNFNTINFSISFPESWRKSISWKNSYLFFEEDKNYGLVIQSFSSDKISCEKILDIYAKKHHDCEIKTVEEFINGNKVFKWIFHFENVKTLEYKRLIASSQVILDISYDIPNDLSNIEFKKATDDFEYIISSINFE